MALQPYSKVVRRNPTLMYKVGYTSHIDANVRQNTKFSNIPLGRDYDVTTIWSAWVPTEVRIQLENDWKYEVPKNVWTEVFYNGITECRSMAYEQSKEYSAKLYKEYPSYQHTEAPGLDHVYFQMLKLKSELKEQRFTKAAK